MAGLAERDERLTLGGVAGLGRQRREACGLLGDGRELFRVEQRRRVGGTHDLGALAELTPGGVTAGGSEDERLWELLARESAGHVETDLGRLALDVPDPVFGESTLRTGSRRRPTDGEAGKVVRVGRLRRAGQFAVLEDAQDPRGVTRERDMRPDARRSRLG